MTTLRKNLLASLALVYRRAHTFVPDAQVWLRREVQKADFAGRSVELTTGETGKTAMSMLAMIHDQIAVVIDGKKRFVAAANVRSVGNVVFGGKQAVKAKIREYEGNVEEIEDAALDDGELKSRVEIDSMDFDELNTYYDKNRSRRPPSISEVEKTIQIQFEGNSAARKEQRNALAKELRLKKYGEEIKYWNYLDERLLKIRNASPAKERYAKEISYLIEAKESAVSQQHKILIEDAIYQLQTKTLGQVKELIKDELPELWYMGAKQFVARLIVKRGGKRYHKSGNDVSGSVYYEMPDGRKVRISDHYLPDTSERWMKRSTGEATGNWHEFVLDEPKPFAELEQEVNDRI